MALLELDGVGKDFALRGGRTLHAVQDVSLAVEPGETLGLVGESGCGKSTLARCIVGLHRPTAGSVRFDGEPIGGGRRSHAVTRDLTMIFQDPFASLNPRRRVADIVADPLDIHGLASGSERRRRVLEMLELVGLDPGHAARYPHEFSGGQRQRIGIARALITRPRLVVCDEPVSALDVSIQAQILNLLAALRDELDLTLVFIAHDLAVVKNVSDRVAVMYLGKLCEIGSPDLLYAQPAHPYTAALLSAIPEPDPERNDEVPSLLQGEIPSNTDPPSGCRFRTRCPRAEARCEVEEPVVRQVALGQFAACHFPLAPGESLETGDVLAEFDLA